MAKVTGAPRKTDKWMVTLWRIGAGSGVRAFGRTMDDAFDRAKELAGPYYLGARPERGQRDIMSEIRGCWMSCEEQMRNRKGGTPRKTSCEDSTRVAAVDLERV